MSANAQDHLAIPELYDNVGGGVTYGQTFVAEASSFHGVRVYLGDPDRALDPSVNELAGPATLYLFDATDLSLPALIGSSEVLGGLETRSGLTSLVLGHPLSTTIGNRYFFGIGTSDQFGLGLRSGSSTYGGGAESFINNLGAVAELPQGRDVSFAIITTENVPKPSAWAAGFLILAAIGSRFRWRKAA